ncbi:hypothetical protein AAFF_G00294730 [Aldrovandia affinis]|uniref:Protein sprouty homolog 1 n=1 Tax=Aldrovandia affinis TaxID=143900 RepID=A0AAD7W1T8_9TELE|nr:hypothetical protein AAFF_G00294730 [Aldrovandia affinis]
MEQQSQRAGLGSLAPVQQPPPRAAILSLDQIRAIRSCNNYTEGPRAPARKMGPETARRRPEKPRERTHELVSVHDNDHDHDDGYDDGYERRARPPGPPQAGPRPPGLSRSVSTGSAASSGSNSSVSSERGLLGRSPPARPDRARHGTKEKEKEKDKEKEKEKDKEKDAASEHRLICERCGRCKCAECTAPRTLPSRLACGGQCLCSADALVEHGTCMCAVKGLFYHCSSDDAGDSCSDSPCSLSRPHCCSRFLCMGLMSALFPCLLCYPPARACVKACQRCHDRLTRPGCRCHNSNTVYCKLENWSPSRPGEALLRAAIRDPFAPGSWTMANNGRLAGFTAGPCHREEVAEAKCYWLLIGVFSPFPVTRELALSARGFRSRSTAYVFQPFAQQQRWARGWVPPVVSGLT